MAALSREAITRAADAWPELTLDHDDFAAYAAAVDAPADLDDEALAELYLACGCSRGDATALALFEARYLAVVPAALAHMRLGTATLDDVRQLVRHKLLVAEPGQAPKLDGYAGRGKLRGLIGVVAVRTAISLLRKGQRHAATGDGLEDLPAAGHDPELRFMKEKYRAAFKRAFERALGELESRDRNFLRLHHFGGLTVEQVGDVYGVHRATATRWLAKIRGALMAATQKHLGAELDVAPGELASLMGLIQSRLEVSVERLLESRDAADDAPPPTSAPRD